MKSSNEPPKRVKAIESTEKFKAFMGRQALKFYFKETSIIATGVYVLLLGRFLHDPIAVLTWTSSVSINRLTCKEYGRSKNISQNRPV